MADSLPQDQSRLHQSFLRLLQTHNTPSVVLSCVLSAHPARPALPPPTRAESLACLRLLSTLASWSLEALDTFLRGFGARNKLVIQIVLAGLDGDCFDAAREADWLLFSFSRHCFREGDTLVQAELLHAYFAAFAVKFAGKVRLADERSFRRAFSSDSCSACSTSKPRPPWFATSSRRWTASCFRWPDSCGTLAFAWYSQR